MEAQPPAPNNASRVICDNIIESPLVCDYCVSNCEAYEGTAGMVIKCQSDGYSYFKGRKLQAMA
jgi:hypothetical protein